MSNQIVISSGAKVRSLEGVLTGTAGIVNSVPLGGANGVATLDSNGKVPLSQLPASVVTYLGTWNAATNTPTLANGTGDVGDLYICNVAGTVNFGAGPITFAVSDWVIYNGSEWQKSSGASGTVTSVAVTESGDALNITGSPITTAGTINIGFAGNSTQYINGEGNLVTFPTLITEAQTLITDVYNETGATLTKGTVVYINGGHGNLPTVTKALATSDATSAQTYGVVQADITNNNNGHVVVIGSLGDLDTQAYAAGTQLYLSSTTAGAWTSTKQYAPAHLVYVGIVVRSHPTQGVVEIKIQNGFELDELHNVSAQTPSNNDGLFYNSSNSLWENKSIATALGYTPANDALVVHLAGTETITGSKTFNSTLFGTDAEFSGSILSPIVAILDNTTYTKVVRLQTTAATNRDVYFPDLNGTVALLEGTQTFSGGKTFSVSVNNDDGLKIKLGSASNLTAGYLTLSAYGETTPLPDRTILRIGTAATQMSLFKLQNTGSYTYDFPASSGTIALTSNLSSYVPYTGATGNVDLGSYSLWASLLIANSSIGGSSGSLILSTGTSGYSTGTNAITLVSSPTTANTLIINSNVSSVNKTAQFSLGSLSATRTYTLPDATGTIALTSNLSSYLPLTGGTLTGALTALTLYSNAGIALSISGQFTGGGGYTGINGQALGIDIRPNSGGIFNLNFSSTTNRTFTFPDASGTLVLGIGTTNYLPKFTGTSTIGNSLVYDNGTNVGIGTILPNELLSLNATGNVNIHLTNATSGTTTNDGFKVGFNTSLNAYLLNKEAGSILFYTSDTLRATIDASGNLGLGVTPSAWSGRTAIQLPDAAYIVSSGAGILLGANVYFDGANRTYISNAVATDYRQVNGEHRWEVAPSGTAGTAISFTQAMTLASTGNLLINTTTDAGYKLDVNGTGRVQSTFNIGTSAASTNLININPNTGSPNIELYGGAGSNSVGGSAYFRLLDYTNTRTALMQINASGGLDFWFNYSSAWYNRITFANTGAATFSSSVTALNFYSQGTLGTISTNTGGNELNFSRNGANYFYGNAANSAFSFVTNGNQGLFQNSSGNVGIGTSSPIRKFSVIGEGGFFNSGNDSHLVLANDGSVSIISSTYTSSGSFTPLTFKTSDAERMRITSGGNVLIGTTSDTGDKFKVVGTNNYWTTVLTAGSTASQSYGLLNKSGTNSSDVCAVFQNASGSTDYLRIRGDGAIYMNSAVYNNTTATSANMFIFGPYDIGRSTSSARFKTQIEDIEQSYVNNIYNMKPKWYRSLCEKDNKDWSHFGFVAEEMAEIEPRLVHWFEEEDGTLRADGVQYDRITALLVKALQDQKNIIDELSAKVTELENKLN